MYFFIVFFGNAADCYAPESCTSLVDPRICDINISVIIHTLPWTFTVKIPSQKINFSTIFLISEWCHKEVLLSRVLCMAKQTLSESWRWPVPSFQDSLLTGTLPSMAVLLPYGIRNWFIWSGMLLYAVMVSTDNSFG